MYNLIFIKKILSEDEDGNFKEEDNLICILKFEDYDVWMDTWEKLSNMNPKEIVEKYQLDTYDISLMQSFDDKFNIIKIHYFDRIIVKFVDDYEFEIIEE